MTAKARDPEAGRIEDQIMRETRLQREHEVKMAEINRQRDQELSRIARDRAEHRNIVVGWVFGGLFIAAVTLAIIAAISHATSEDRRNRQELENRNRQVAETCIREGNLWVDGDCLITRRTD